MNYFSRQSLLLTVTATSLLTIGAYTLFQSQTTTLKTKEATEASIGNPQSLSFAYKAWKEKTQKWDMNRKIALPFTYRKGLSVDTPPTKATGTASLDLDRGVLDVVISYLPTEVNYDLWLVDRFPDKDEDNNIRLGQLSHDGNLSSFQSRLNSKQLQGVEMDQLVITLANQTPRQGAILFATPSLFQRIYYDEIRGKSHRVASIVSDSAGYFNFLIPSPAYANVDGVNLTQLIAQGEQLFFNEDFEGNGRTCGTCHRAENNFTIDPSFIANLPSNDPLFVAEFDPALADLEDPELMRNFGLIKTNGDGFDDLDNKFTMRSVSHMLGMSLSIQSNAEQAPFDMTGWSGDGAPGAGRLRDFATGAVIQHFTRSLDRVENVDFRLPTENELDALEAFTLSLGRQQETDLNSLTLSHQDAEKGRKMFLADDSQNQTVQAAKCNICHRNAGALTVAGVNSNFNTGVDNMPHPAALIGRSLPRDGGFGTDENPNGGFGNQSFNTTSLWEAADTAPYFHHNGATTLEDAISFYESDTFRMSEEGQRLKLQDTGGDELFIEVDALAAFLRIINVLENLRSTGDFATRAKTNDLLGSSNELILASADLEDILFVLEEGELHIEDAVPHFYDAREALDLALDANSIAERNIQIDQMIAHLETGKQLMVTFGISDTLAPLVTITTPTEGDSVSNVVLVSVNAMDDSAIESVRYQINGVNIGLSTSEPYETFWDTTLDADGIASVSAIATDTSGNSSLASITVTVDNVSTQPDDIEAPVVAITSPGAFASISGPVLIRVDASDNVGVSQLIVKIDQTELSTLFAAPYEFNWESSTVNDGEHTLSVIAIDTSGNTTIINQSVNVFNAQPCTVYSCPNPEPPSSEPPPDSTAPVGSSADGEFDGIVSAKSNQLATITVTMEDGNSIILTLTSDTNFQGSVASDITQILVGHVIQGEFFTSVGEALWVDVDLPPGL